MARYDEVTLNDITMTGSIDLPLETLFDALDEVELHVFMKYLFSIHSIDTVAAHVIEVLQQRDR